MSGGGLYSLATIGAKDVIDKTLTRVVTALDNSQPIAPDAMLTFSDMGCADGGTSLGLWRGVIDHLRNNRSHTGDIQIVYADQPNNDFSALAKITHGLTEFDTYLDEFERVYILQSGASFYTPILPDNTLDLGFSATAMHWLRGKPLDITGHVHMVGAQGAEQQAFAEQAKRDWTAILLQRARELKPGGKLVLANFCRDEQGKYLGATEGVNMFDTFNDIWQGFVDDNIITAPEYQSMTLPQYYNTVEEFSAPFEDADSEVVKAGLHIESIETGHIPCPFAEDFKVHGDAKRFAEAYVPTIRSWNESTWFAALSPERDLTERREIIEHYYSTYQSRVEEQPTQHRMDYIHAYMTISRQAD